MTPRVLAFWVVFAATMAVYATMGLWTIPRIEDAAGGLRAFDLRPFGYSADAARAFLAALTTEGRAVYLGPQAVLDLVYPPLMAATVVLAFSLILPRRPRLLWAFLMALPFLALGFDWLENWRVRGLLTAPGEVTDAMIAGASQATVMKSVAYSLEYVALLLALAAAGWRRWRR